MNAFVRQLAVLSVIWSLCELLLPNGKQQKMVRMTVSMLVMAALISGIAGFLGKDQSLTLDIPVFSQLAENQGEGYAATSLKSIANQAENLTKRIARNAGYQAGAAVYLREDGALDHIDLNIQGWLRDDTPPLISETELLSRIADAFQIDVSKLWLTTLMDGAIMP